MDFFDKEDLVEYVTVNLDSNESYTQKKVEEEETVEAFDLPLLNAVYNDWSEKNSKVSKMRINTQKARRKQDFLMKNLETNFFNIEEFEILGADKESIGPSKMKLGESKKIRYEPIVMDIVKKEPSIRTAKKVFDLPIINAVHNDWLEKKLLEKNIQHVKIG